MFFRYCLALALSSTLFVCGCGGGVEVDSTPAAGPEVTSQDQFKERLEFIANSGGMGSAMAGMVEMAEKNGDASLIADAKKLQQVSKPDDAKAIAKRMLEKFK